MLVGFFILITIMMMIIIIGLWDLKTETVPTGSDRNTWPTGKV